LTYGFEILGEQEGPGTATSGKRRRFGSGVAATDNDDVEPLGHSRAA
jgi:hypothetical protein